MNQVRIIGGGLAGSEAAWQLARRGIAVELFEMRPEKRTDAHSSAYLGELVCSNSLRSNSLTAPAGLLKAGDAPVEFAGAPRSGRKLRSGGLSVGGRSRPFCAGAYPSRRRVAQRRCRSPGASRSSSGVVIVATGPLTSPALSQRLTEMLGAEHLYFYDAISPIVTAESIDMTVAYCASRYGKEGDDYLNLPMTREQYDRFVDALLAAERVPTHSFERFVPFEGCMPIEEMADRGKQTLSFGPMRAVGLNDPRTENGPTPWFNFARKTARRRSIIWSAFKPK